ncbi:MAG: nucleotidyltransferase family protein, partial [Solirubrobacteraceae bacterium]
MLETLGGRIVDVARDRAPGWFHQLAGRAVAAQAQRESWVELALVRLIAVLSAEGIASLPLKGPLLSKALYRQAGRRPCADIDLLVTSEDLPRAVDAAVGLGYARPADPVGHDGLPRLHFRLLDPGGLPPLELHWRVHWYESRFSRDMLLRSRARSHGVRRARLADELASLLLFYARDGLADLRLACDLAAWCDAFGAQLEPGAVGALVACYPALGRPLMAAAAAAERTVGF